MGINPKYLPKGAKGDRLRYYSAKASASVLLRLITCAKVDKDMSDIEKVKIVVQAYNFTGEGYIDWLRKNYNGKQTQRAITRYKDKVFSYGDDKYLQKVMPYYYAPAK